MTTDSETLEPSDVLPIDKPSTGRLEGKVAIVIGAGSSGPGWGNGKAAAALFAREGAQVVCVDVNDEAVAETVDIIGGRGGTALAVTADISDDSSHAAIVSQTLQRFGRIDVLHNNVGILRPGGLTESRVEDWNLTLDVNLTGAYKMCRAAIPALLESRGSIIVVSSIAALRYLGVSQISYSVSKAGLLQLTQSMALEYAQHGVRVNAIVPGLMNTPMVLGPAARASGVDVRELVTRREALCPMGHMGDAWDVAHAALFLASDDSRYVTATSLVVDGGITARCAVL